MLKITFFCVFLTYIIQSSVAAPSKINLATASQDEVFSYFPNADNITIDKLTAEQVDVVSQFATEKGINIEEALVFLRITSRKMQNRIEGKPSNTGLTKTWVCSKLNAAPRSPTPVNETLSDFQEIIKRMRSVCSGSSSSELF